MELTIELPLTAPEAEGLHRCLNNGVSPQDTIRTISEFLRDRSRSESACLVACDLAMAHTDGITVYHHLDASTWGEITPIKRAAAVVACAGMVCDILAERALRVSTNEVAA